MRRAKLTVALLSGLAALLLLAGPAAAASPWWHLTSGSRPTDLQREAAGEIVLTATNLGDAPANGESTPVRITGELPPGLKALSVKGLVGQTETGMTCSLPSTQKVECTYAGEVPPYSQAMVVLNVEVLSGAASGEPTEASVSGGGADPAELTRPLEISEASTPFGVEGYELENEEEGGGPDEQAGSHPFQQTTTITLNQALDNRGLGVPAALPKNLSFKWPAGLLGDPIPVVQCPLGHFLVSEAEGGKPERDGCPAQSAVGVASVLINLNDGLFAPSVKRFVVPLFNLEPAFGEPARLGFMVAETPVVIDASVRNGPDYGITVNIHNTPQSVGFLSSQVTVWGVPGDSRHVDLRGFSCLNAAQGTKHELPCSPLEESHPPAFLTLPTSCAGQPLSTVEGNSWLDPGPLAELASYTLPTLDGCNRLPFAPTIHSEPTSNAATSPTGLDFDLNVNDEGLTNPEGLVQSQIKKTVVTLPEGFTSNPSVAEGLKVCSEEAYEASTDQPGTGCPEESKIGSVEVESPLATQKQKLSGSLYVAKQTENPFHNLLTLYMVIRSPELGVLVKSAGKVEPNPVTGQLTTTFDNLPQLPVSHFHLAFRQGQRSPLVTPPACGTYTVKALLYPYSEPGTPLQEESSFQITQGPEGNGCPSGGVPPFHPNLEAGTINNAAGTYSPFYVHMTRKDSEQEITHFSIKLPPGVSGKLAGVPYCPDAGIAAAKAREHEGGGTEEEASPSCPAASEVGHSLVGSGVGNVLAYAPGKMYLAGPYHGSNLSLVSITSAKVGPFDLGTVVVRFALRLNPETAEVFVDATGSDPIPHIVDGIPVHLRDIRAYVDRPQFVLNPTGCEPTSTASTVLGSGLNFASEADDQPVTVTSPFQAADCASLGFKPSLKLSLLGGTKRGAHPRFKAVLTARPGDANIGRAQVTLPHSEFLENAHIKTICTRTVFNQGNVPGEKCPPDSVYGFAKATTPILAEPLEGPVFLRASSNKLPDLVAALHNSQVNIALDGHVEGVNGGIRNTFEAVPDAPVTKFTLEMQGGNKGLLVNSANLCAGPHHATADFTGHNGKLDDFKPLLAVSCAKKGKHKKGKRHRSHRAGG